MTERDGLRAENETLRARLTGLTGAILRISEDLELDTVLQEIVDSARSLTDARYGAITTQDQAGDIEDLLISGLASADLERVLEFDPSREFFKHLSRREEPLRTGDFVALAEAAGFPGFYPPITTFLGTRIRIRERHVGNIYIGEKEGGGEFTREDEETLEMFAAQAALAITNARRYGQEQRAKADLEALVNTSPVGVLVVDARTRKVVIVNQEAGRLLGVPDAEGSDVARLIEAVTLRRMDGTRLPPDDLPMEQAIRGGETLRAEEIVIQRPDETEVATLVNTTPILSDDGKLVSVVATIQDLTPLEELERLRTEFLGMVSHELRTPLTSIKGSAATARGASSPLDPAETRQFFRIIEEQADHMRDLINNLLDLTRIEAGTLSVAPEPADIAAVIEQAKNAFLSSGHRHDIEVEPLPELPRVAADGQRITQVLHNLFANAASYSQEWSTIRVGTSWSEPYVVVSVTDEGTGIATEDLPLLFSKFSRVEAGDGLRIGGYGLGLAICRGIVEAHGGRIWAESDGPGRGTRFVFTLPAVDATAADSGADFLEADPDQLSLESERILVVDDDPQILRYVRNTLGEAGYASTVTADPGALGDLLAAGQPDLVLLNLVLPGTDGFDLMKLVRDRSNVPIIFLSGRGRGEDIAKALELGAADYVVKPFSPAELVARVRAALRKREAYEQAAALEPYVVGDLVINYVDRTVTIAGRPVPLTPTEFKLLAELAAMNGGVVAHDELLQRVWGDEDARDASILRSFVKNIRQKLGDEADNPSYIFTEPRVGYRLAKS